MPAPKQPDRGALERLATLIDRTLYTIAPRAALRRELARTRLDVMRLHYEAGGRGRRFAGWRANSQSADSTTRGGVLNRIRDRSRDLYRNNAYARRGIRIMTSNVVGTGIRPQPFEGDQPDTVLSRKVEAAWANWAESTDCDADGDRDLYGIQRLVQRTAMMSGEALVRRRIRLRTDGLTVPLQLQVLEPDYLDTSKDGDATVGQNQRVRRIQGVEFDLIGRRRGYWLFKEHPGGQSISGSSTSASSFVPASEILHVRATDRPGQVRGVPSLASCVVRLRDIDEFLDATLMKMKIAAMLAGFLHDANLEDTLPSEAEKKDGEKPEIEFEPGTIEILPSGKQITFSNPPSLEGIPDYVKVELRAIASALDVTYEQLTGDYSNVSFISGRMGWIENRQAVDEWRWDVLVPQFCTPVWSWFDQVATLALGLDIGSTRPLWTAPRREMIDPKQEVDAIRLAVRTGLSSLSQAIREQGDDPDEVLRELSQDVKKANALGLKLESDPTHDANRTPDVPKTPPK